MKIFIQSRNKTFSRRFSGRAKQLLRTLGISPETAIISRDNELLTEEDILRDTDEVVILSVVSGG